METIQTVFMVVANILIIDFYLFSGKVAAFIKSIFVQKKKTESTEEKPSEEKITKEEDIISNESIVKTKTKAITLKNLLITILITLAITVIILSINGIIQPKKWFRKPPVSEFKFCVRDTTIYKNTYINLQEQLIVEPEHFRDRIIWTHKGEKIEKAKLVLHGQLADSGQYIASIKYRFFFVKKDTLDLHVIEQPKDPCEGRSIKKIPNIKRNNTVVLKEIDKEIKPIGFNNGYEFEWRNEKDEIISVARETGLYVVIVKDKDNECKIRDTVKITINKPEPPDPLYQKPDEVGVDMAKIKYYQNKIITNKLSPDDIFSIYIIAEIKNWAQLEKLRKLLETDRIVFPNSTIEEGYVVVYNKVGRIMERFSKGKKSPEQIEKIKNYDKEGYNIWRFNITIPKMINP
jgi:hypothetical protein